MVSNIKKQEIGTECVAEVKDWLMKAILQWPTHHIGQDTLVNSTSENELGNSLTITQDVWSILEISSKEILATQPKRPQLWFPLRMTKRIEQSIALHLASIWNVDCGGNPTEPSTFWAWTSLLCWVHAYSHFYVSLFAPTKLLRRWLPWRVFAVKI